MNSLDLVTLSVCGIAPEYKHQATEAIVVSACALSPFSSLTVPPVGQAYVLHHFAQTLRFHVNADQSEWNRNVNTDTLSQRHRFRNDSVPVKEGP